LLIATECVVCVLCYVSDIYSIIKFSLQLLATAFIVFVTCSTISQLTKPVASRLYKLFARPVLPGSWF